MSQNSYPKSNPYVSLMKTAWKYASEDRRKYINVYIRFVFSNLVHALEPILWGLFINQVQLQGIDILQSAWMYVGAYLMVRLIDWFFHGTARIMERELAFNMSKRFLQELYFKAVHLPVKWHQDNHSGATINRIRKAYEALRGFFQHGFEYLHSMSKFILSFAAMIYFAPLFGSLALLMGAGIVWIILLFDKPFIQKLKEVNEKEHVVSSTLFDSLSNIITVITLRLEKRMEEDVIKRVMDVFPPFKSKIRINEWKWFTVDMLVGFIYAFILVGYVYQNYIPGEVFLIGNLVILMGYVEKFTSVFHNVAYLYTQVVQYDTDVKTAYNIIEAYDALNPNQTQASLPKDWQHIQIEQLDFQHHLGEKATEEVQKMPGLKKVNIDIQKGKKIAFIGESGSGKSTLLALLRGLYLPKEVQLKLDHQSYPNLGIISDHVTLFPQEPEIFENTIEYNITLGLDHEAAELEEVCQIAQFADVVEQLPNGYASSIREKGVNLSGGQKQRLALARGIFAAKESDLILLDEPTSSVDPKTELGIYDRLFKAFADKAILSSLHRMHLLPKFDYIYIMEQGEIVDHGKFEDLYQNSPLFKTMWAHQESIDLRH
ncbi:MAG: ABC transporter ATP-binding protein [Bacteroidota bacterium]